MACPHPPLPRSLMPPATLRPQSVSPAPCWLAAATASMTSACASTVTPTSGSTSPTCSTTCRSPPTSRDRCAAAARCCYFLLPAAAAAWRRRRPGAGDAAAALPQWDFGSAFPTLRAYPPPPAADLLLARRSVPHARHAGPHPGAGPGAGGAPRGPDVRPALVRPRRPMRLGHLAARRGCVRAGGAGGAGIPGRCRVGWEGSVWTEHGACDCLPCPPPARRRPSVLHQVCSALAAPRRPPQATPLARTSASSSPTPTGSRSSRGRTSWCGGVACGGGGRRRRALRLCCGGGRQQLVAAWSHYSRGTPAPVRSSLPHLVASSA